MEIVVSLLELASRNVSIEVVSQQTTEEKYMEPIANMAQLGKHGFPGAFSP
jgi:hypothetical protein